MSRVRVAIAWRQERGSHDRRGLQSFLGQLVVSLSTTERDLGSTEGDDHNSSARQVS